MLGTQARFFILVTTTLATLVGCTGGSRPSSSAQKAAADLFSNRPINAVPDLYVITLTKPALLAAGTKSGGKWQIPAQAKAELLAEQAQFEQKLQSVASTARVIFRYRMTLNAVAVYAAPQDIPAIIQLSGASAVRPAMQFARPQALDTEPSVGGLAGKVNSASFIGAEEAYKQGFTGAGMRVGVLDTGIDYTHKMLGGSGDAAEFKSVNPAQPSTLFPNAKIVGGIDLAGTGFNAASPFDADRLPQPDANPIDESGHGTHVAGTIAGIGDGTNSYDGVAKDATVYAIKVFGKDGSTMDAVVIAGFEFAADPNGDMNPDDQLDVINLSLGGGFGQPQILYNEAAGTLSRAGTVVVASAGNSGPVDYIVGAPSTANDALSVAASIDGTEHNWRFPAVRFIAPNNPDWLAKALEGSISKPIAEIGPTEGELVDIGLGDTPLTDEVKAKLQGNVALIQRGKVAFTVKLQLAFDNGAVGAVVYNNEPGKPIPMGGEGKIEIPAIMVSQALGLKLLEEMKVGATRVQFKTGEIIEQPELIDTITEFSSKGPRSQDNLLKPEIAAPGQAIISAGMGEGNGAVKMDGTSMAGPHVAGVMAVLKQARGQLDSSGLKALAMNTAKVLGTEALPIPISLQGAGRVQIDQALASPVVIEPAGLSLGRVALTGVNANKSEKLSVRNISTRDVTLEIATEANPGLTLQVSSASITVPAGQTVELPLEAVFNLTATDAYAAELNGRVSFKEGGKVVAHVPALAIRTLASNIRAPAGAVTGPVSFTNGSAVEGLALAFNLLGEDRVKAPLSPSEAWKSRECDLQSAGYRVIQRTTPAGVVDVLQLGFKLYSPLTTWNICEVSVLIDADEDGVADQELVGSAAGSIEGVAPAALASVLLDAAKAREIRLAYETAIGTGQKPEVNYTPAVVDASGMAAFAHSTVAMIEARIDKLAKTADGKLNIRMAALNVGGDSIESDDYLGEGLADWAKISLRPEEHAFFGMSEFSMVGAAGGAATLTRGAGQGKLLLYYPINQIDASGSDSQFQILD